MPLADCSGPRLICPLFHRFSGVRVVARSLSLLLLLPCLVIAQAAKAQAVAQQSKAGTFERRIVGILDAGGRPETVQDRLARAGHGLTLTHDQTVAVEAMRALLRGRSASKGLSLAEAEAFAARNPGSPASSILFAEAALAEDQPQRSADSLISFAARAGSLVELVSPATVSKLTDALDIAADKTRTAGLAKALLGAGWSRGSASLRSYLALAAIRDGLASSQLDSARRLLPVIASPASLQLIMIDNRLAPLRADVARSAGPRLERAWHEYLIRTRDDWLRRGDAVSASAYAEALKQAGRHETLVEAFLARFMRGYNCATDLVGRSLAADLVDSLVKVGRWTKAEDVMRRSGGVSVPVYAAMLLERGEFARASTLFDRSLKAAEPPNNDKEAKAMAWLQAIAACAAYRKGERPGPAGYDAKLLDLGTRLLVELCLDRPGEARAALLEALDAEEDRADALRWVQPFADPPVQSAFRKDTSGRIRDLQRDPAVVAAVARHGLILDWPLSIAAPDAAALAAGAPPPAPWQCGDDPYPQVEIDGSGSIRLPNSQP